MCHTTPTTWASWLPFAEFWYNTNFHTATRKTPFEVLYGTPAPIHRPYLLGLSKVEAVDRSLQQRDQTIDILKQNLCKAQNRMRQLADRRRSERVFEIGDWVYVKLQPYKQSSVATRPYPKLATKYYGPYQIIKKIGMVAYKLQLPATSKIHATFHVSLLKKHYGPSPIATDDTLPQTFDTTGSVMEKVPEKVLEVRSVKQRNAAVVHWLVQWAQQPREDATWESATDIIRKFLQFDPWGQGYLNGGSIDTLCMEAWPARMTAGTAANEVEKTRELDSDKMGADGKEFVMLKGPLTKNGAAGGTSG